MVIRWSQPATTSILATSLAVIGARDLSLNEYLRIKVNIYPSSHQGILTSNTDRTVQQP